MNGQQQYSCCFSGHRNISSDDIELTRKIVVSVKNLILRGVNTFYLGGAIGFDMLCASVLSHLKSNGENIRIVFSLPSPDYMKYWNLKQKNTQKKLLEFADEIVYVSEHYDHGCMFRRNRYMVDRSGYCICYINRNTGGTAYTVEYAKKRGLEIINIANGV